MADTGGNGDRDTRLDRIERALELLIADHEQFRDDHKQLLTAQVLQKDAIDGLVIVTQEHTRQLEEHTRQIEEQGRQLRQLGEETDRRIRELVSGFGECLRHDRGPEKR